MAATARSFYAVQACDSLSRLLAWKAVIKTLKTLIHRCSVFTSRVREFTGADAEAMALVEEVDPVLRPVDHLAKLRTFAREPLTRAVLSQRSKRDKGWQESGSAFYAVRMANCSAIEGLGL
ncbi:hypothetical protein ACVILI_006747 [Mesorhizobium sp. USDA 4775]|nr:hypothetical protein MCHK_8210 [Mesorhizobium huakuii 7653R]QGU21118.1 hypothetical protein MCHK_11835 [Mesorhizobium huakuii 7653R]